MVATAAGRITPHRAPPYEEFYLRHEFAYLFSGKSTKTAVTRAALFDSSMHQIVCRLGSPSAPQTLQLGLRGSILSGREGKGKDGRGIDVNTLKKFFKNVRNVKT